MDALAVLFERPLALSLAPVALITPTPADVVVETEWTGVSSGTERLLWSGRMPAFPGMGYPLVPGYESVGRIVDAGPESGRQVGERVFVGGARCYETARALFGGAASRLVAPGSRVVPIQPALESRGILLALAATALHAVNGPDGPPELVVGHGALGRLVARLAMTLNGGRPVTVWETDGRRREGGTGYEVRDPADDPRRDYRTVCDVSGDPAIIDALVPRLAPGGEIVLAGFYGESLSFGFPPAFQREARLRIAAQWRHDELCTVARMANEGTLPLDDLITHHRGVHAAASAYDTAFGDAACIKMVLDWRNPA